MESGVQENRTTVTEFILLGLTGNIGLQPILFAVFLFAYVATVGDNLSILAAIFVESKLHTPMYYFLGNLSLLDIGCITVTVPPMLACLLVHQCRVPYAACISQLFFFHLLAGVDCHLLTAMACDRYLAICQPLTYSTHMSHEVQGALVGICCTISFINALTHTVAVSALDFCGPNVVNHFYCDLPPLFQLSCSSSHLNGQLLFVGATFMVVIPIILISISYAHVALAVLRIRSAEGRKKTFSTCGSHLTVVCIFYGTGFFSYMCLGSVSASDKDKGIGIYNSILNPMLNPVIYSLRNPDVQGVLKRVLMWKRLPA
ncbi:olfactory receptor 139-like [Choloepus didactylus]|uniref:olfactory receptor 139-like n=1 Tax=Choloepus didactylus TaxID=27675 RepID=UPI00189CFCCD|nr:olfactory receptor 139-like [Choloepus didactylus]